MRSITVQAGGPLRGRLNVPGDKSISHRALLFAAGAQGRSTLQGLSTGADVARTRAAIVAMGCDVSTVDESRVLVDGGRQRLAEPVDIIDLGNSGTGMRLITGWSTGLPWLTVLTGDESLRSRPMGRVIDPLKRMGADIDGRQGGDRSPLVIRGGELQAIDYTPPVASAQIKSAILLAGLSADGTTVVREPVATRRHTEELLALTGADAEVEEDPGGGLIVRVRRSELQAFCLDIPGDPSQAAFWMVAGIVVPGSDVTIENVYVGPGRNGLIGVLQRMGADIDLEYRCSTAADICVRHSTLNGVEVGGDEIPSLIDEIPVLSVAAAVAEGTTRISGAEEMRVKESDRISAIVTQMRVLGVGIAEAPDGFSITGKPGTSLDGGEVEAGLDHRIAMTGAVAALLASSSVTIKGWDSVATSYPNFAEDLARLRN